MTPSWNFLPPENSGAQTPQSPTPKASADLYSALEDTHAALIESVKIAHLTKDPEAKPLSSLLDSLERVFSRILSREVQK